MMNAETPQPYALLTLSEDDEVTLKLAQAFALADVLHIAASSDDGPNTESVAWVSSMICDHLGRVEELMKVGRKRDSEARGVKAPA
jgi:predicted amidohydrolase